VQFAAFEAVLLLASGLHKMIRRDRTQAVVREFAGVRGLRSVRGRGSRFARVAGEPVAVDAVVSNGGRCARGADLGGYLALILRAIAQGRRMWIAGAPSRQPASAGCIPSGEEYRVDRCGVAGGGGVAGGITGPVVASQILAAFVLVALYGALDQVMALTPPRRGELL